eukprot:COSAG02_NODE_27229_length_614_cov_1.099029_1_plen_22_part_01
MVPGAHTVVFRVVFATAVKRDA